MATSRKQLRQQRRNQRDKRYAMNRKLKRQGKSWTERRAIIRRRRRADRSDRKAAHHLRKAEQRDRVLRPQDRAGGRRARAQNRPGQTTVAPGSGMSIPRQPAGSPFPFARPPVVRPGGGVFRPPVRRPSPGYGARMPGAARSVMPPMSAPYPSAPYPSAPYPSSAYADPYASSSYPMDPYAMDPYAMDPYAMDPYAMDPYAMDPYGMGLVDPYDDNAILVDIDNVDYASFAGESEVWDEFAGDVVDIAGEIAGEIAGAGVSGLIGEDEDAGGGLINLEELVEKIGRRRIRELKVVATIDAWPQEAFERDAAAIVEAVNAVEDALEEAIEETDAVSGVHVGAAGLLASAAALPVLSSVIPKLVGARGDQEERRDRRRRRRQRNADQRAEERFQSLADRIDQVDRHRSGLLEVDSGEWGGASRAGDVIVRAKAGKRAALATLPGGFYLVREVDEGVSTAEVQSTMGAAAEAAAAAMADAGIAGCNCTHRPATYR